MFRLVLFHLDVLKTERVSHNFGTKSSRRGTSFQRRWLKTYDRELLIVEYKDLAESHAILREIRKNRRNWKKKNNREMNIYLNVREITRRHMTKGESKDPKETNIMFCLNCCRARGIYYLSTNGNKPYARGLPVKNQRTTNRKRSSSRQY